MLYKKPISSEDYFPIYSKAKVYVGNRIHGAMLIIGAGGSSFAIGYDSRLNMVSYVGGSISTPSKVIGPS